MVALPFTIEANDGLTVTEGILRLEPSQLVIEYQTKDGIFGLIKSPPTDIIVPAEKVTNAVYKKSFWTSQIILNADSIHVFANLPGSKHGEAKFKVKKKLADTAREFVTELNMYIYESHIKKMERE